MSDLLPYDNDKFPGIRDYSGAQPSHKGHGIDEILDVVHRLAVAGILSCVVGVRALRYYGAARVTDVRKYEFPASQPILPSLCIGMGSLHPGRQTRNSPASPP